MGDYLGRIDRSEEIIQSLEQIDSYLKTYNVDVMIVAGDLFNYRNRPAQIQSSIGEIKRIFLPFLQSGGTIIAVSGNHDHAAIGEINLNAFNPVAAAALRWTRNTLLPESSHYLDALPAIKEIKGITLAHGSPRHPVWEYITDAVLAEQNFDHFTGTLCLVGHTHFARVFHHDGNQCNELIAPTGQQFGLNAGRYILNPGGLGQPRDHNPWAAYALLDLAAASWEQRRVPYNIAETQRRMQAHGLSEALINRLGFGV